jgi:uncharacterized protein YecT (DUF1311 family)
VAIRSTPLRQFFGKQWRKTVSPFFDLIHTLCPSCYKLNVHTKTVCLLIAMALGTEATDGSFAQTQSAMNSDACNRLKKADAELNHVYQQVLASKATDADFLKAFRQAQRAWISFRDAHVRSIFPDPNPRAYGSVYPMCRCSVLERITAERTQELQHLWIDGLEEGDVCTGSCRIKEHR